MMYMKWVICVLLSMVCVQFPLSCQIRPPRRILFIMGHLGTGGTEQAFVALLNLWSIPDTQVEIYLKKRGGALEQFLRRDFPIITKKEAFSRTYDAAACFYGWGANPQKEVVRAHAKRKVQWIHTDLLQCPADTFFNHKDLCQGVDAFVCVGNKPAESARKIQPQWSHKIFAIRNVLDQESIKKKALQVDPLFPKDAFCNVISIGRLSPEKGFDRAVRVHSRLDREGIFFRWYIVGAGDMQAPLLRQIHEAGLDTKFFLLGEKSNPYPYLSKADIFVLPSLFEGCSVAVNEAKVLGRPILLTDVGAAREQIDSGVNGLVVSSDEEAIYQGLKKLLLDKNLRQKFTTALNGYEYDNNTIYQQIEQVLFK